MIEELLLPYVTYHDWSLYYSVKSTDSFFKNFFYRFMHFIYNLSILCYNEFILSSFYLNYMYDPLTLKYFYLDPDIGNGFKGYIPMVFGLSVLIESLKLLINHILILKDWWCDFFLFLIHLYIQNGNLVSVLDYCWFLLFESSKTNLLIFYQTLNSFINPTFTGCSFLFGFWSIFLYYLFIVVLITSCLLVYCYTSAYGLKFLFRFYFICTLLLCCVFFNQICTLINLLPGMGDSLLFNILIIFSVSQVLLFILGIYFKFIMRNIKIDDELPTLNVFVYNALNNYLYSKFNLNDNFKNDDGSPMSLLEFIFWLIIVLLEYYERPLFNFFIYIYGGFFIITLITSIIDAHQLTNMISAVVWFPFTTGWDSVLEVIFIGFALTLFSFLTVVSFILQIICFWKILNNLINQ